MLRHESAESLALTFSQSTPNTVITKKYQQTLNSKGFRMHPYLSLQSPDRHSTPRFFSSEAVDKPVCNTDARNTADQTHAPNADASKQRFLSEPVYAPLHEPVLSYLHNWLHETGETHQQMDEPVASFHNYYDEVRSMSDSLIHNFKLHPYEILYQKASIPAAEIQSIIPLPLPLSGLDMANMSYALCRTLGGSQPQGLYAYKEALKLFMGQDGVHYFKRYEKDAAQRIGISPIDLTESDQIFSDDSVYTNNAMRYCSMINLAHQALNDTRKSVSLPQAKNMMKSYLKTNLELIANLRHASLLAVSTGEASAKSNAPEPPTNLKAIPLSLSLKTLQRPTWGSSSSHGIGPAALAEQFLQQLSLHHVERIHIKAYGSLGATGKPHNLHLNVICALRGIKPNDFNSDYGHVLTEWENTGTVTLANDRSVQLSFDWIPDEELRVDGIPHSLTIPNGIVFSAWDDQHNQLTELKGYSIGGGFALRSDEIIQSLNTSPDTGTTKPHQSDLAFRSAASLIRAMQSMNTNCLTEFWLAYEKQINHLDRDTLLEHAKTLTRLMINNTKYASRVPTAIPNIDHQLQAPIFARANILNHTTQFKRRLPNLAAQAAAGSMAVASTAGCVCWGNALQVPLGPTIGSAGVLPGVLIPFLTQHTGMDVNTTSTEELIQKLGDKALLDFFAGSTIGLILTKYQSSHAAASHGCMGEVGNSSIAGVMAYLNAMLADSKSMTTLEQVHNPFQVVKKQLVKTPVSETPVDEIAIGEVAVGEKSASPYDKAHKLNFEKLNTTLIAAQYVMHFYDGLTCTPAEGRVGSPCNVRNEQSFTPILTAALAVLSHNSTPKTLKDGKHIAEAFDRSAIEQDIIGRNMSTALRETDEEKVMTGTGDGLTTNGLTTNDLTTDAVMTDIEDLGLSHHTPRYATLSGPLMHKLESLLREQVSTNYPLQNDVPYKLDAF
ncbi:MAG: serine dehydratase beta chain [Gammaproteobacteria bacterium]